MNSKETMHYNSYDFIAAAINLIHIDKVTIPMRQEAWAKYGSMEKTDFEKYQTLVKRCVKMLVDNGFYGPPPEQTLQDLKDLVFGPKEN